MKNHIKDSRTQVRISLLLTNLFNPRLRLTVTLALHVCKFKNKNRRTTCEQIRFSPRMKRDEGVDMSVVLIVSL